MAGSLGSLVIELAANTARLSSDMGKAVGIVERGSQTMTKALKFLGGTAIVGSLTAVIGKSIQVGDELSKAAIKAGIGGQAMSELAHAAKMSDVELSGLSNALRFMQKNLSEAGTGAKAPLDALRALGLQLSDIRGLAADQQFELLADRIASIQDPADRARAATELFGRAGADLLPMFENGAKGIRAAREEAQKLGQSFSDEQIKKLADADDAIKRLKSSWEGFATALTAKVAPAISHVLDLLSGANKNEQTARVALIMDLQKQLQERAFGVGPEATARYALIRQQIRRLQTEAEGIGESARGRQRSAGPSGPAPGYVAAVEAESDLTEIIVDHQRIRLSAVDAFYDGLNERTMTSVERQVSALEQVEAELGILLADGKITADQFHARWREAMEDTFPPLETNFEKLGGKVKKVAGEMTEYALEAARSMQQSLSAFLFDPFDDGLKGMVKGLANTLRQMVADVAAAKILGGLGGEAGVAGFLGGLLGFANGGSFKVGGSGGTDSQLVAFKATPGENVSISKPGQGSGSSAQQININVDARGAQEGVAQQLQMLLPAVVREAVTRSRAAVWDDMSRKGYAR